MGSPKSGLKPYSQALYALIVDGEWHTFGAIYTACAHLIPPEVAYRNITYKGDERSLETIIYAGRRNIIRTRLRQLECVKREENGEIWYRLNP